MAGGGLGSVLCERWRGVFLVSRARRGALCRREGPLGRRLCVCEGALPLGVTAGWERTKSPGWSWKRKEMVFFFLRSNLAIRNTHCRRRMTDFRSTSLPRFIHETVVVRAVFVWKLALVGFLSSLVDLYNASPLDLP